MVRAESGEHAPRVLKSLLFTHAGGGGACPDGFKIEACAIALNKEVGMTTRPGDLGMDGKPAPAAQICLMQVQLPEGRLELLVVLALEPPPQLVGVL